MLWIFYFLLTTEERNQYMMAKSKGYKRTGSKDTSLFLYGYETTYYFDPSKPPKRDYLTWKEFWKARGY